MVVSPVPAAEKDCGHDAARQHSMDPAVCKGGRKQGGEATGVFHRRAGRCAS